MFWTRFGSGVWFHNDTCRVAARSGASRRVHETEITFNDREKKRWSRRLRAIRKKNGADDSLLAEGKYLFNAPGKGRAGSRKK